ncbi:MFS transporter [Pseudonocardia sp. EV170527-09]|uniref:MFS transporter n=1 Tax=Pseudonocardia sp. EV170527-09 TaxID=2603411 RepID=UPI0011F36B29|nr:MFS transporter [Pseudonocardia sp. EV170527-09]KAA1027858.1 MFS transporter [Pseudonocardia sp. EV170527-09]
MPLGTIVLLQASSGSFAFAGLAAGAQSIAIALGGLCVGAVARWIPPRRIGFWAALLNAASIMLLLLASRNAGPLVIVAVAVLVGLTQPQVGPLVRVHWSGQLRGGDNHLVRTAMSYEGAADEASFVLGPAMVGLLLLVPTAAWGFPQAGPLLGAAVLLVVAAAPLARQYADLPREDTTFGTDPGGRTTGTSAADATPVSDSAAAGPGVRLHWPSLMTLTVAMVSVGVIFGVVQTGVAAYAEAEGSPELAGLYFAELGIGSAVAGAACAWLPRWFGLALRRWLFPLALVLGMLVLLWGAVAGSLPVAIAVAGLAVGPYMVTLYSLTEAQTPLPSMATAMAVLCAGGPIGTAAGQFGAGLIADRVGATSVFVIAPIAAAVGLAASLANTRTFSSRLLEGGTASGRAVDSEADVGSRDAADVRPGDREAG